MGDFVAQQNEKYELELKKNPYYLKLWLTYLAYNQENDEIFRYKLYERALVFLPRSYKLWHAYLVERTSAVNDKSVIGITHSLSNLGYLLTYSLTHLLDKRLELLVDCYERALVHLNKMPRIWLDYIDLMMSMLKGTETRKVFDRALQSLPVTQHKNVWKLYIGKIHFLLTNSPRAAYLLIR
jgi:pre-mRNA-splicing factor SYF1